jgi:hypothetical protein
MVGILRNGALVALAMMLMPLSPALAAHDEETYATLHASEPALATGMARIYFYRDSGIMGVAIQPTIMIDGVSAGGRAKPGDYFYVDRPAGTYVVSTTTEKKEAVTLTLSAGQSMYVRMDVLPGFFVGHVAPSIIDPQQATDEIKDCDFHPPEPVEPEAAAVAPSQAAAPPAAPATTPATTPAPPAATSAAPETSTPTAPAPTSAVQTPAGPTPSPPPSN